MDHRPWYVTDPSLYQEIRAEVENTYPDLAFLNANGRVVVQGQLPLFEGGIVHDRWHIELEPDPKSPRGLHIVKETGGRIPREDDRHVNTNGTLCVALPDAYWYEHPNGMTICEFLKGPVTGFFAAQTLLERGHPDPWPAGEWGHGNRGVIGFYQERLGLKTPTQTLRGIDFLASKKLKNHWPCPCGSGRKIGECHRRVMDELRQRIPRAVITRSLAAVRQAPPPPATIK